MAKIGEKSCVANYFLSFSPILMKFGTDVLPLGVDVQDTFFDSGRKCVAMVTAYYTVGRKNTVERGVLITFSDISSFNWVGFLFFWQLQR